MLPRYHLQINRELITGLDDIKPERQPCWFSFDAKPDSHTARVFGRTHFVCTGTALHDGHHTVQSDGDVIYEVKMSFYEPT